MKKMLLALTFVFTALLVSGVQAQDAKKVEIINLMSKDYTVTR